MTTLLDQARRLLAVAQSGLHYTRSEFERERYEEIAQLAAQMLSSESSLTARQLRDAWIVDRLQHTKLDVRGAMFRTIPCCWYERSDGKWTVPGGFAV
jgi:hypothetical protein